MVKLRLKRFGRKKRPFYRIVAMDVNKQRDGQALAELGTYDPLVATFTLDEDAAVQWLKDGAQMTPTVHDLLKSQGVLARIQGSEGKVRENALKTEKPKRRKKLAGAAVVKADAETAEATPEATAEAAPEATAEAAPEATVEAAPDATAEAAPEATVEAAPDVTAEAAPEATVEAAPDATAEAAPEVAAEADQSSDDASAEGETESGDKGS